MTENAFPKAIQFHFESESDLEAENVQGDVCLTLYLF